MQTQDTITTARFIHADGSVTVEPARPVFDAAGELVAYTPVKPWEVESFEPEAVDDFDLDQDSELRDAVTGESLGPATKAEVDAMRDLDALEGCSVFDRQGMWGDELVSPAFECARWAGRPCVVVLFDSREG